MDMQGVWVQEPTVSFDGSDPDPDPDREMLIKSDGKEEEVRRGGGGEGGEQLTAWHPQLTIANEDG